VAQREHVLVLDARLSAALGRVDVLAADRARRARVAGHTASLGEVLGGELRSAANVARLEVARRQRRDRVESEQIGERAELAVLRRGRAERALTQIAGGGEHALRVGGGALRRRTHGDRLDVLGPEHCAQPAAAGVAPSWETVA
jgi:hypothetical protein